MVRNLAIFSWGLPNEWSITATPIRLERECNFTAAHWNVQKPMCLEFGSCCADDTVPADGANSSMPAFKCMMYINSLYFLYCNHTRSFTPQFI